MGYEVNPQHSDVQAAVDAGMNLGEPKTLSSDGRVVGVLVPAGSRFEQIDLEKHQYRPSRKKGNVTLATAQSFIDWVNRNKTPETVIYASEDRTNFRAIFNGHEANVQATGGGEEEGQPFRHGGAGWGDFTAEYHCPLSTEWMRWHGKSQHDSDVKKGMPHAEYIQFVEDNLLDVTSPASGLLLSMVRAFESKKDVNFKSAARLDNGDIAFSYTEDTQMTGRLTLPETFEITIPVFKGGVPYAIDAKLRYRVTSGGLVLWHELVRPHKSLEHAFKAVSDSIRDGTDVPMFNT